MPLLETTGAASARGFGFAGASGPPPVSPLGNINLGTINYVTSYNTGVSSALGLTFKRDGTSFYVTKYDTGLVYQYNLSSAWNISTASQYTSLDLGRGNISDIWFSDDGANMFVVDRSSEDAVLRYTVSTPWNLNSISFNSQSNLSVSNIDGLRVSPDNLTFMVQTQSPPCPLYGWVSSTPNTITSLTNSGSLGITPLTGGLLTSCLGMTLNNQGYFYYGMQFDGSGFMYKVQLNTAFRPGNGGTYLGRVALPNGGFSFGNMDQLYIQETLRYLYCVDHSGGRVYQWSYSNV